MSEEEPAQEFEKKALAAGAQALYDSDRQKMIRRSQTVIELESFGSNLWQGK